MKKIVMSAALLALPLAFAEDAVVEHNEVAVEQGHAAYEGFYFGFGVQASEVGHKVEYTWMNGTTDTNADHRQTRLGGTITLGFGKKMKTNRAYLGIEAGLDFGPATTEHYADKYGSERLAAGVSTVYYDLNIKHNSFIPSLALRLGFVDCDTKIMTYLKAGAAYSKVNAYYIDWDRVAVYKGRTDFKCSGITPLIALGVEKAFAKKMTGRLEAEYRFGHSKSAAGYGVNFPLTGGSVVGSDSNKLIQKGTITVRAMFCYNVKI